MISASAGDRAVRWLKFNLVGAGGVLVQLATMALLTRGLGIDYLVATAVAVETAVLHNFAWHERFTWRDRAAGGFRDSALRLVRFNAGNGALSLAGNLALMRLFVGVAHVPPLLANVLSIAACSLANFFVSDLWVFRAAKEATRYVSGDCAAALRLSAARMRRGSTSPNLPLPGVPNAK